MERSGIRESTIASFKRFLNLFPHGADQTFVILKGHLLIEEQVWQVIEENVKSSTPLKELRLGCHAEIAFAESLVANDSEEDLWKFLRRLNNIRNKIAHNVKPTGLNESIDSFVNDYPAPTYSDDPACQFEFCLWSLFLWVAEYVESPTKAVEEVTKEKDA
jgi:hypothetical protein